VTALLALAVAKRPPSKGMKNQDLLEIAFQSGVSMSTYEIKLDKYLTHRFIDNLQFSLRNGDE